MQTVKAQMIRAHKINLANIGDNVKFEYKGETRQGIINATRPTFLNIFDFDRNEYRSFKVAEMKNFRVVASNGPNVPQDVE